MYCVCVWEECISNEVVSEIRFAVTSVHKISPQNRPWRPIPGSFTLWKETLFPMYRRLWVGPWSSLVCCSKSCAYEIQSPDPPVCSEALYLCWPRQQNIRNNTAHCAHQHIRYTRNTAHIRYTWNTVHIRYTRNTVHTRYTRLRTSGSQETAHISHKKDCSISCVSDVRSIYHLMCAVFIVYLMCTVFLMSDVCIIYCASDVRSISGVWCVQCFMCIWYA